MITKEQATTLVEQVIADFTHNEQDEMTFKGLDLIKEYIEGSYSTKDIKIVETSKDKVSVGIEDLALVEIFRFALEANNLSNYDVETCLTMLPDGSAAMNYLPKMAVIAKRKPHVILN